MTISCLLCSSVFAQSHHHHEANAEVKKATEEVVRVLSDKIEPSTENCPKHGDPAYVNFDVKHLKDPEGSHGMLFFGEETFYISHLPMYHKPHDYQAIVEVKMSPASAAKYRARKKGNKNIFTFAPDNNFVLPDAIVNKKPITGQLFDGHFERGGEEFLPVDLELVRVVFYKKISATEPRPPKEKFVSFGKGKEFFLAHEITKRPDFDEIIPVSSEALGTALTSEIVTKGTVPLKSVTIEGKNMTLKQGAITAKVPYNSYYRETGDLKD